jgi:protein-tyrosine phosphatase
MKTYEDDEFERIEREMKWRQIPDDLPNDLPKDLPKAIPFITEEELEQLLKEET